MNTISLTTQNDTSTQERVSDFLSIASAALISGIALLLVAITF
jgi:hypothetical protein